MTIEQVKEEAKKRFGMDLTNEQAQAYLDANLSGELREEDLEKITGGLFCSWKCPPIEQTPPGGAGDVTRRRGAISCTSCGWSATYLYDPRFPNSQLHELIQCHSQFSPDCHSFDPKYTDKGPA